MIFSIFASKRTKWKKRLTKAFDVYIPGLQGMDDEELGMLLDQAVQIKDASLITLDKNDRERLFWEDPALLDEKESLDRTPSKLIKSINQISIFCDQESAKELKI